MNKNTIIISMIIMIALFTMPMALANPALTASLVRYEPLPAEPGQYATVYIQLENNGNDDASSAFVEIAKEFPFTSVEKRLNIGTLKSQQSYVAEFNVKVDSNAVIGNNELKVIYGYKDENNNEQTRETSLRIEVKSSDATLSIVGVTTEPEEVKPGEETTVTLTLKNTANHALKDITAKINLEITQGTTTTDLPFIPTKVTEEYVSKIDSGKLATISFPIKSYPTATPGYYKIPVELTYYDDEGSSYSKSDYLGIIISAVPELKLFLDNSEVTELNKPGDITLKFVNKGISDLKFLEIDIMEGEGYTLHSSSQEYIGDLDSDDYRTQDYSITLTEENPKIKVRATYKDENNKDYTVIENIEVKFKQEIVEAKGMSTGTIIIIILLLVVVVWFVRKQLKKNSKKRR